MLGTARAEEMSPPSIYTHMVAFQHKETLWSAGGVFHVRIPLELHFLEDDAN